MSFGSIPIPSSRPTTKILAKIFLDKLEEENNMEVLLSKLSHLVNVAFNNGDMDGKQFREFKNAINIILEDYEH